MERESLRVSGYGLLSRYRGELMGLAMLWVMLFHAYKLRFGVLLLDRGPGRLSYHLSGWALNILPALALHRWIEAARTRLTALRRPLLKP